MTEADGPSERVIRLRRPPTLLAHEAPFVPDGCSLDEVDDRWQALRAANPAYFDGRVLHVGGVHRNGCGGAVIHVSDCAYRFYAVQDATFDLGVRPLGVKGLTSLNGRWLLGRRAECVAGYPGQWEFAPGGGVEPGRRPVEVVVRELAEETGLRPAREPTATAMLYDPIVRTWEIVYRIEPDSDAIPDATDEYAALSWCRAGAWPAPLTPIAARLAAMATESGSPPSPTG